MNTPASAVVPSREAVDELVDRFLAWPVPATECADLCASMTGYPHQRVGTNFLSAESAKAMLLHVLADWLNAAKSEIDSLRAEVERLTDWQDRHTECVSELRATVADQGALIKQWEARCQAAWDQGDKDGDEMRGMAIKLADQAAALAERDKDAERYRWLRHGDNDDEVIRYTSRHTANAYVLREEKLDIAIDAALAASVSSASEEGGNG